MSENVWLGVLAIGGGCALLFALFLVVLRAQGQTSSGWRARGELALCLVGFLAICAFAFADWTDVSSEVAAGATWDEAGLSGLLGPALLALGLLRMIWVRLPSLRRAGHRGTSA